MQVIIDGKKANFTPAPGMSAYQVAVKNGFTGTETEWLESLKGSGWQEYSTEEIPVGTWIDGKTIYRRVFKGISGPRNVDTEYGEIPNIETAIFMRGTIYHSSVYGVVSIPEVSAELQLKGTKLFIAVTVPQLVNQPFTSIIDYTKTTD